MSSDNNTLVDSKLALSFFLDSLLKETELPEAATVATEPLVSLVVKEEAAATEIEVATESQVAVELLPDIIEEEPVQEEILDLKDVINVREKTEVSSKVIETAEPEEEIEPELALGQVEHTVDIPNEPFQALMFKVAGLSLAVRLIELSGVLEWDESILTEMPGHSPFFMGVIQYLGKSIPIVDTARLVFPADKLVSLSADKPYERVKRIVLIDDGKWGLACDEIAEVVDLDAESVKWRENRSKRKWMAGTVIEHMCALVDASGFSEMLDDGSHNRK